MPTTCDGFEGFRDLILSVVLTRWPPMIRSYSRPSWPRTRSMAARILRALSSFVKSKNGSLMKGPWWVDVRGGRTGSSRVAMGVPFESLRRNNHFTPRDGRGAPAAKRRKNAAHGGGPQVLSCKEAAYSVSPHVKGNQARVRAPSQHK